jgi:hypothetical protein
MNPLRKLVEALRPRPRDPADAAEAQRLRDEIETNRLSQRSTAGPNYQSGRGPGL